MRYNTDRNKLIYLFLFLALSVNGNWIPNYITNNLPTLGTNIVEITDIYIKGSTNSISLSELKSGDDVMILFSVAYNVTPPAGKFYGPNLVGHISIVLPHPPDAPKIKIVL